jgi:hypothetical protein
MRIKIEVLYEERILLWKAESLDQAIEMAEKEAKEYEKNTNCVYIGLTQGYHTYIDQPKSGSKVFSLMREDDLPADEYLDLYFDTGGERQTNYKD